MNLDVPQLEFILLDERDPWAKSMQTMGVCGAAASITNAN